MDTLTHALSGALSARATARARDSKLYIPVRRRVGIGFVVAMLPDLDVVMTWFSPLSYLYFHRGVTHSLVMLPVWVLLLAFLCSRIWRDQRDWRAYAGVVACALGAHILGDLLTSFGTMLLAPLSDRRFALGTTFIIDLWFSGILLAGLLASLLRRRSRIPAIGALLVLSAYVGVQAIARDRALDYGAEYAQAQGFAAYEIDASPRPVSPFNWTVIIATDEQLHYSHVNVVRKRSRTPSANAGFLERLDAPYQALTEASWHSVNRWGSASERELTREVWRQPAFAFFRWFAQYPYVYRIDRDAQSTCAWFQDLRFMTPGRAAVPFRYGMCRNATADWQPFQLIDDKVWQAVH